MRHVVRWGGIDADGRYSYEERVTIWGVESFDDAIRHAEQEAAAYASELVNDGEVLDLWQACRIAQPADVEDEEAMLRLSGSGAEVFSLIRDSELPVKEYLDRFFDTGTEHQGKSA